jgi:hypothetical protein
MKHDKKSIPYTRHAYKIAIDPCVPYGAVFFANDNNSLMVLLTMTTTMKMMRSTTIMMIIALEVTIF